MTKDQLTFFIYEQSEKEFLANFLNVGVEDIEEVGDYLLYKRIEKKVYEMSDEEVERFVVEHSIS